MNLLVVGLNHRSAPVEVREQLAFAPATLGEATCNLLGAAPLREAAILSTCNRVEVYGLTGDVGAASAGNRKFLCAQRGVAGPIDAHLYEHHGAGCVAHVLDVACGLDSMVLGETEILGQMKAAYEQARLAGATGAVLNRLFQKSFRAAKQIRSETAIARGSTSVGNVGVETIVAEVNNTPWGERHCYVLPQRLNEGQGGLGRYRPTKAMHVSPFMPMDVDYDWRFGAPGRSRGSALTVHMENARGGRKIFDATLDLGREEITAGSLARALALYPLMTLKVIAAIHWQALKLCAKGAPVHVHPSEPGRELEKTG